MVNLFELLEDWLEDWFFRWFRTPKNRIETKDDAPDLDVDAASAVPDMATTNRFSLKTSQTQGQSAESEAQAGTTQRWRSGKSVLASLQVVTGDAAGRSFLLQSSTLIGRGEDVDVHLPDPTVSKHHARVVVSTKGYLVQDLGSTNGTKVNGQAVDESAISPGDIIKVGLTEMKMTVGERPTATRKRE